uniref:PH domain-containing protein n=1 Tax=Paramoeba aestuarina TaxID=180227 RepID=A0A7S4P946_9EUKA|mmetsp:Transcript_38465/g.60959  ORF Transcript_38465/g.60959 Transcript_38465/m.60959 type:complete len:112 (+) Transcript_38465:646-981(+)
MLITQPPKQGLFHQNSKTYTLNIVVHFEKATAVVPLADSDHVRYSFIIDTPKTSLMFYAQSEEDKEEWVNSIANYLQKTKENIGSFSVRQRKRKPTRLKDYMWKQQNENEK